MLNRRQFLISIGGVALTSSLAYLSYREQKNIWLVSACSDKSGQHYVAAVDLSGQVISKIATPARGHEVIPHPNKPGHAFVFARRPGTYMLEVNFKEGRVINHIVPASGSHFYGHGLVYGNHLLTSENDYNNGIGKIFLRNLDTFKVEKVFESGGVGPHQIAMMPNDSTLVVANGGIHTHPSMPRKKLNLATMRPNLSYLDVNSGNVLESLELTNHQLSIRHLAVSKKGQVIAGLQYQGPKTDLVPLAISHKGEASLQYLQAPNSQWRRMNQYTASVCIDDKANLAAISCPRSDMLTYWSLDNKQFVSSERLADGAGLTFSDGFIASSGKGLVGKVGDIKNARRFNELRWDNHLGHIIGT